MEKHCFDYAYEQRKSISHQVNSVAFFLSYICTKWNQV